MANFSFLKEISSNLSPSWELDCITILNSSDFDWRHGLVDGAGKAVSTFTTETWGVNIETCYSYCNITAIPIAQTFNFGSFAASMTNYFLPWLALTAQLPFETGSISSNIMSFCLAVGSPALITMSLVITILNRSWIHHTFSELQTRASEPAIRGRYAIFNERIQAMMCLLQEAQQVALRASQQNGWLSSLIVVPANGEWWRRLKRSIERSRRGLTASLIAQMLVAAIAYIFTVVSAFKADFGDPATALQIASGSVWIWLVQIRPTHALIEEQTDVLAIAQIPVILGWILVGTQYSHHTIDEALHPEPATRALEPGITKEGRPYITDKQHGLVVRAGLTPLPYKVQTTNGAFETPRESSKLKVPTWLGAEIGGDEAEEGPIYNYARLFTWWKLASTIHHAIDETLDNIQEGISCANIIDHPRRVAQVQGTSVVSQSNAPLLQPERASPIQTALLEDWQMDSEDANAKLSGDSRQTAQYCGLLEGEIRAYPDWTEMNSGVYVRLVLAMCVSMFLQWGTTGASIIIAYTTPKIGLGCRSASYTFYGSLATLTWVLLLISMAFSHEAMRRYQAEHIEDPSINFQVGHSSKTSSQGNYERRGWHSFYCAGAVITRWLGKSCAVINTFWLIASSLMEFIGIFDNCWCKSDASAGGGNGWVVLFKDATDLAAAAAAPWGGGLALTLIVCATCCVFFVVPS